MPANSVKNIVVLMLENRAFDHMLGYLPRSASYPIESLTGNEFNLEDPGNPTSTPVRVNNQAKYQGDLKLSEFQQSLVNLVNSLDTGESHSLTLTRSARLIETEHEAAVHTRETAARFLGL